MSHPWETRYPQGVRRESGIPAGTLPDLMTRSAVRDGGRTMIGFRGREISVAGLSARINAAAACLRAGYGKDTTAALLLGNMPDHPVNFFGAEPFSLEALRDFWSGKVGRHGLPAALEFRDESPGTAAGKLSPRELRVQSNEARRDTPA